MMAYLANACNNFKYLGKDGEEAAAIDFDHELSSLESDSDELDENVSDRIFDIMEGFHKYELCY